MKITRWAIQTNVTANEKIKAEREAAKAAALKAKEEKAKEKADKKEQRLIISVIKEFTLS